MAKSRKPKVDREARDAEKTLLIAQKFIALLEQGTAPWRKPWAGDQFPRSLATGKEYQGVNFMFLLAVCMVEGYESPYFVGYQGAINRGGHVRKGESGWPIRVIDSRPVKDEDGNVVVKDGREQYRTYHSWETVFNVAQCEGVDAPPPPVSNPDSSPLEAAEQIIAGMPQPPLYEENILPRAYYRPATDTVHLPLRSTFESMEHFYAVRFHELTHSTGHSSRLNREAVSRLESQDGQQAAFGDADYSMEELVAELGAARLCAEAGIENVALEANSAAYFAGWVAALKAEPKIILDAAAAAQKAVNFILGANHE